VPSTSKWSNEGRISTTDDPRTKLGYDIATRWNSTYVMLESAIKYQRDFGCLAVCDKNYVHCTSNGELKKAKNVST